jgi:hypothetical protein
VTKLNETYSEYLTAERGGPFFFKIMMDKLQNNSKDVTTYLISVVKNLKITDYDYPDYLLSFYILCVPYCSEICFQISIH